MAKDKAILNVRRRDIPRQLDKLLHFTRIEFGKMFLMRQRQEYEDDEARIPPLEGQATSSNKRFLIKKSSSNRVTFY